MTSLEAKVREILGSMVRPMSMPGEHLSLDEATTSILALIEGEVRAERERCAKVAGNSPCGCGECLTCAYYSDIAKAIRSSGEAK